MGFLLVSRPIWWYLPLALLESFSIPFPVPVDESMRTIRAIFRGFRTVLLLIPPPRRREEVFFLFFYHLEGNLPIGLWFNQCPPFLFSGPPYSRHVSILVNGAVDVFFPFLLLRIKSTAQGEVRSPPPTPPTSPPSKPVYSMRTPLSLDFSTTPTSHPSPPSHVNCLFFLRSPDHSSFLRGVF